MDGLMAAQLCGIISGLGCCILLGLRKLEVRDCYKSSASRGGGEYRPRCKGLKQALKRALVQA